MVSFRFENPDLAPARLAELFRFRDGKICEIRPYYFDPKPLVDAWAYYSASWHDIHSHNKKPRMAGLDPYWAGLAQIFINGLMQMPDPAFLIAG